MTLDALNGQFGIAGALEFVAGPGGMPHARLRAGDATAEVAVHGGHVLTYSRGEGPPLLWVSRQAIYQAGKAVRGGIPVCWPWFGPHPDDPARPAHGFARTQIWQVLGGGSGPAGAWLRLGLGDSPATMALWPHPFALELTVTVGPALELALAAHNPGPAPFVYTGALHSYFSVGDVTRVAITGLEGARYLDQLTGATLTQAGPVTVAGEVDRIYQETTAACVIDDPALGRRITVAKAGSRSTVVWNPWVEKARRLADFGDDEYPEMLCVETANAPGDSVELAPGASHTLRATIL